MGEGTNKWTQAGPPQASSCHDHTQKAGTHTAGLVSGYKANLPLQMSEVKGLGVWGGGVSCSHRPWGTGGVLLSKLSADPGEGDRGLLPHGVRTAGMWPLKGAQPLPN